MSPRHIRQTPQTRQPVSPVYRGPQAMQQPLLAQPGSTAPIQYHAPNAALLIDFDNVTMGIRSDLAAELKSLLSSDIVRGKVSVQRAYADWRRYPQYIVPLSESSIDLIFAPAYGSSKKNATDIRLAIDALELVFTRPEIGTFILLSGDSDFSSLVIKLKEYGKYVIGVGIRESSSDLLVQNCDEYYSYNALAGLVNTKDEEVVKWDPWELASEAIQRMKRNGDVMRADRLKQVMQQIDSSFDEKNLGMSKFSRFVIEGSHRGVMTLNKMENGQYEVDLPRTAEDIALSATAVEAVPASDTIGGTADSVTAASPASVNGEERRPHRGRPPRRGWKQGGRGDGRSRVDAAPADAVAITDADSMDTGAVNAEAPPAAVTSTISASASASAPSSRSARNEDVQLALPVSAPSDDVGLSGMRLTRDEAFDIVRRAVKSSVVGDTPVLASKVRLEARRLLGRDSESLSERNFNRILQDAHNGDIVDLKRRGNDYEVSPVVETASIAEQLSLTAAAQAAVAAEANGSGPSASAGSRGPARGMGPRGIPSSRSGFGKKSVDLPADLLSIGVVNYVSAAPAKPVVNAAPPVVIPTPNVASANDKVAMSRSGRGRRKGGASKGTSAAVAPTAPVTPVPASSASTSARPADNGASQPQRGRGRGRPPASNAAAASTGSRGQATPAASAPAKNASAPVKNASAPAKNNSAPSRNAAPARGGAVARTGRKVVAKKTATKRTGR